MTVTTRNVDHVEVVTIDRPQKRNALDHATYAALADALRSADADPGVGAIVLTGSGGHFSAGNDLAEFVVVDGDPTSAPGPAAAIDLLRALVDCDTPIIAAVEGHAVGIGVTALLHCALAYCGRGARFRLPFTALGLTPEGGSTVLLPAAAGPKLAAELLLSSDPFDAGTALRAGLVNAVVDDGQALDTALATAARIAALPAAAVAESWRLVRPDRAAVRAAIETEIEVFAARLATPEAQAIIQSLQRR